MKKIIIFLSVILIFSGCQTASKSYIVDMNKALELIIPIHKNYISADAKLTDPEKAVMMKASDEVLALSRKAKEELGVSEPAVSN